ncbi:transmembrane protein 223 [Bacillus rossius redtenbacheri]|uniref:transmembrane protein 223 n=1 Tax=Bacillus rossius redtenbacheri TaxID=93214 RepID=UPI002FDCBCFB
MLRIVTSVLLHVSKSPHISLSHYSVNNYLSTDCSKLLSFASYVYKSCARNLRIRKNLSDEAIGLVNSGVRKISTQSAAYSTGIEENTKVVKDVLLYRYDRLKYMRALSLFGVSQYLFWTFLGHTTYTTLKDVPVEEKNDNDPWWKKINLGEQKYRLGITILCLVVGHGLLASTWLYSLKSIRYLVLRKGGNNVSIVTYTPVGQTRTITTDLNKVSCTESRLSARVHLPVKVKGYSLYFMLDKDGEFFNPQLFDRTVGMRRQLN